MANDKFNTTVGQIRRREEWMRHNEVTITYADGSQETRTDQAMQLPILADYERYLRSSKWRAKRLAVLKRDNYCCVQCGFGKYLHVHHLTYANLGHEPLSDLETLCQRCHKDSHGLGLPLEEEAA